MLENFWVKVWGCCWLTTAVTGRETSWLTKVTEDCLGSESPTVLYCWFWLLNCWFWVLNCWFWFLYCWFWLLNCWFWVLICWVWVYCLFWVKVWGCCWLTTVVTPAVTGRETSWLTKVTEERLGSESPTVLYCWFWLSNCWLWMTCWFWLLNCWFWVLNCWLWLYWTVGLS